MTEDEYPPRRPRFISNYVTGLLGRYTEAYVQEINEKFDEVISGVDCIILTRGEFCMSNKSLSRSPISMLVSLTRDANEGYESSFEYVDTVQYADKRSRWGITKGMLARARAREEFPI